MDSKSGFQKELDKINLERNKIRKQIQQIRADKEKLRDEFYTKMVDFEYQKQLLSDIQWIENMKH